MSALLQPLLNAVPVLQEKLRVPGLGLCLIQDGEISHLLGYGYANKQKSLPVVKDTLFQVSSVAQLITTWAVMKLVQQGKLLLDTPITQIVKTFQLPQNEWNSDITVRSILSHTSGLSIKSFLGSEHANRHDLRQLLQGAYNERYRLEVVSKPGDHFDYSSGGFALLQIALEDITQEPFDVFARREILSPMRMDDSTFNYDEYISNPMRAKPYNVYGGRVPEYQFPTMAAAGLMSTIQDFATFALAHFSYGNSIAGAGILDEDMMKLMFTKINRNSIIGLGYLVRTVANTKLLTHACMNRGWFARMDLFPQKGDGIVLISNSINGQNLVAKLFPLWFYAMGIKHKPFDYSSFGLHTNDRKKLFYGDRLYAEQYALRN